MEIGNNISNPYSKVCVPKVIKNITAKVFDLMSWKNKIKQNGMKLVNMCVD